MIKEYEIMYYIPMYLSEKIELKGIDKKFRIILWENVPNKIKLLLTQNDDNIPESVAVIKGELDNISFAKIKLLSLIFNRIYYVYQWTDGKIVTKCPTPFTSFSNNPRKLIRKDKINIFMKKALKNINNPKIQRMISYYYEINIRIDAIEIKLVTLVSLLEHIANTHNFKKEIIISNRWKTSMKKSFIEEVIKNGYVDSIKTASISPKYNKLTNDLSQLNEKSIKEKIVLLCNKCKLNVSGETLGTIFKLRNDWTHGSNDIDYDDMYNAYPKLKTIVEMLLVYELSGNDLKYQTYLNSFHDKNDIVRWEHFFE